MWNEFDSGMSTSDAGYMDESRMDTTTDDDKKGRRADNLVPVMIGHITTSGPEILLYGTPVRVVSLLGKIINIDQVTTKITYTIEDDTGSIKAIKWNPEDESNSKDQLLHIGSYVRVYGLPREQDGEKHVLILRICPIQTLNELTSHLLEVMYVAQAAGAKARQQPGKKVGVADTTSAMQNLECTGMDKDQALVFNIITNDGSDSGIERDEIKAKVPSHIVSKVDDILEFLAGEGHIYTTRTDNHFKAT